jgi:glycerol-3-phosphate dehydrogenase
MNQQPQAESRLAESRLAESRLAPELSMRTRRMNLDRFEREPFDLAIIGGGITGAGVALDAASRNISVALVEKRDFASGTSSRSSKLIHGGLRYLEQFQFALVGEALRERALLSSVAPHLSRPLAFLVPVYAGQTRSPLGSNRLKLRAGLWLYDLLAGRKNIARHRWLTREEALRLAPALDSNHLKGCFLYYDCLTDDARLVIEVVKAAAGFGAVVANYAEARSFIRAGGRITGVRVADRLDNRVIDLRAKVIVNATGVWADEVSRIADPNAAIRLRPSKGIHVVMASEKFCNQAAVLIPSLGEQRFLFVIPWQGRTLIGTTDTDYAGDLDEPRAESEEVRRIVESAARFFPGAQISAEDVISSFAGLRPLVGGDDKTTAELSRREEIFESEAGLISITGGKLTTYRRMSERVVDLAIERLASGKGVRRAGKQPSITSRIPLAGGVVATQGLREGLTRTADEYGMPVGTVEHLIDTYGGNYKKLLEISRESEGLKARLSPDLPHIESEVLYAARYEMALSLDDFLARRTRIALLAPNGGSDVAERVARLMGRELGLTSAELQNAKAEIG